MLGAFVVLVALIQFGWFPEGALAGKSSKARLMEHIMSQGYRLQSENFTFTQKRDHFDPTDNKTWAQRYTVNDTYWAPGGPVFLFLSGEAPMEFFEFQEISALEWAKELGALYVVLEHRFYGESNPEESLSTSHLAYLTSQQALADAAYFIENFNQTLKNPGPWVVFGCSYSGALSAWFRLKYPHLVVGSVAPSGPVHAQVNFSSYIDQFSRSASPDCVAAVRQATIQIESFLALGDDGIAQLGALFNSCHTLTEDDLYNFLSDIIDTIGGSDQMSNPPSYLLNETCNILTKNSGNYLQNYVEAFNFNLLYPLGYNPEDGSGSGSSSESGSGSTSESGSGSGSSGSGSASCNDFRISSYMNYMKSTKLGNMDRSWYWQTCAEFGWYQASYPPTSAFPALPVEPQIQYCEDFYGIKGMTPDTDWTNAYYGGYNLQATNVLFTNGLLDPWHLMSIIENEGGVKAVTYEAGHCGTMIRPSDLDPVSLTNARAAVLAFLQSLV